jgi:hypothetical protein
MYKMLEEKGHGNAISSKGTLYKVEAKNHSIVAFPRKGTITIHSDCWGNSETCQGTWAGGIYNGPYSIYDWYNGKPIDLALATAGKPAKEFVMDYAQIIANINAYLTNNFGLAEFLYSRSLDLRYAKLIEKVPTVKSLTELQKEIAKFFVFRGLKNEQIHNLLLAADKEKNTIAAVKDTCDVEAVYKLYEDTLKKLCNAVHKNQKVNTAKLMHLYNPEIPLYDNRVLQFLKKMGMKPSTKVNEYYDILHIYQCAQSDTALSQTVAALKSQVYKNIPPLVNDIKFFDTLCYSLE